MCIGWRGVDWWAGRWRLHVIGDSGVRRRRKPHNHMQQDRHGHRKQVHDVPGQSESTSCSHQSHRRRAGRHYQLVAAHDFLAAATLNHHHQLLLLMCCLTSGGSLNCFCVRFSQYFNGRLCWLTLEMKRKRSLYFDFFLREMKSCRLHAARFARYNVILLFDRKSRHVTSCLVIWQPALRCVCSIVSAETGCTIYTESCWFAQLSVLLTHL